MNEVFRKKSLDRVNSPEDLNEYMRVTNPPTWFALVCVILLLIGVIFWGITAKLETRAKTVVVSGENGVVCYVRADDITAVKVNTPVRIGDREYRVSRIGEEITLPNGDLSEYEMSLGGFQGGENVYAVTLKGDAISKSTEADIILEEISPVSFLLSSVD